MFSENPCVAEVTDICSDRFKTSRYNPSVRMAKMWFSCKYDEATVQGNFSEVLGLLLSRKIPDGTGRLPMEIPCVGYP